MTPRELGILLPLVGIAWACSDGRPGLDDLATPDAASRDAGLASPLDPPADPIVRLASASFAPEGARLAQSLGVVGDEVLACTGDQVSVWSADTLAPLRATLLGAPCLALAADATTAIAVASDGSWTVLGGASVPGPAAVALALEESHVFAALSEPGVASAPRDLSAPPTIYPVAQDPRDVLPLADGLLVSDGLHGVRWMTLAAGVPSVADELAIAGVAQGLARVGKTRAVVAVSGTGLALLGVSGGLELLGVLPIPGFAVDVAVDGEGHALVADWTHVRLADLADPAQMDLLAHEPKPTGWGARGVAHGALGWYALGLQEVVRLAADPTVSAPALQMRRHQLRFHQDYDNRFGRGGAVWDNVGTAELLITNPTTSNDRLVVSELQSGAAAPAGVSLLVLPADSGYVQVTVNGTEPLEGTLSAATNDPDQPLVEVPVAFNLPSLAAGDPAPDFILPALAGDVIRLSERRGSVVYLKLFNAL